MAAKENGEVSDAPTIRMLLPQRARIIGKKIQEKMEVCDSLT
jgi:hypothetical protein